MMLLDMARQDVRYGVRALLRNLRFTTVSILALALGICVNTTVFTAYKAFIARPLDARDPGAMVNVTLRLQSGALQANLSYPDYEAYRDHLRSYSGVVAVFNDELRLTAPETLGGQRSAEAGSLIGRLGLLQRTSSNAEAATAFVVSENFFQVLGVRALDGRTFDSIGRAELVRSPVALVSENYWRRRFAGDPHVVGASIRLNGTTFTIIGITPHNFVGTSVAVPAFWLPLSLEPVVHPDSRRLRDREDFCCRVFGRLAPGVTRQQAEAETTALASQLRPLHDPRSRLGHDVTAVISPGSPLPGEMNSGLRLTVLLIVIGVAMVLVIACANVASLQLARATTRLQELAMRLTLGASRRRLVQQLLTESLMIGLVAGLVALPVTWALMHVAATWAADLLPVEVGTIVFDVTPDLGTFAYVFAISAGAGILFGLAPAIQSSRSALLSTVRGSAGSSPGSSRFRHGLVAGQVAVSLALLIAGIMLVRSADRALRMNTGYDSDRVIDVSFAFPDESIYTPDHKAAVIHDLRSRIAGLPGVSAVASARAPDDHGARRAAVSLSGEPPSDRNMSAVLYYTWVQPNYFQTLGIPLSRGVGFPPGADGSDRSAIVSQSAARRLWPGQDPIGHTLRLGTNDQFHGKAELLPDGPTWQVIGVARDTRGVTLDGSDSQQVYLPLPADHIQDYPLLVRTTSDPVAVMAAIEPVIAAVDPSLMASTSTLQAMLRETDAFLAASMSAAIASTISIFGLLLAVMGIYSTASYLVVVRTREIGIRMAVGATGQDVVALMIRDGFRSVLTGLCAGLMLGAGASRLLRGVLYGLDTVDALAFAGAVLGFISVALVATWLPSRRAVRVDPLVALRYE